MPLIVFVPSGVSVTLGSRKGPTSALRCGGMLYVPGWTRWTSYQSSSKKISKVQAIGSRPGCPLPEVLHGEEWALRSEGCTGAACMKLADARPPIFVHKSRSC